ncbi:NADPH-dependent F420 reductase [Duganella callida]|uniref:NADP oxidoreductase n=1 Tax=Duganella callida TaxID=2561932 RepID=A0A4Y9SD52_9BURK|nr:NAD(P)-binding domain-containing protein [Duganella callida]TFW18687.1 NADP oxidoreductase [Duganella callida]
MKIGFIGAGEVAVAIARYAISAGHEVVLSNSGNPAKLSAVIAQLGPEASAASASEAAQAPLVVLAVPWTKVRTVLASLPAWQNRVLIDATNPFLQISPSWILEDLGEDTASEIVARLADGARVVKAFNSVLMKNFSSASAEGRDKRLLLVSGNDADANATVVDLINSFGFAAIVLGTLRAGGKLQQAGGALAGHDLWIRG